MAVVRFRRQLLLLSLIVASAAAMAAPAWADDPPRQRERGGPMRDDPRDPRPSRSERQRAQDAMADSVRRFERSRDDRVLSVERMQSDGRDVNRIKAMDDRGRVRVYVDDPQDRQGRPERPQPRGPRTRGSDD
jgi:hypothetical protein